MDKYIIYATDKKVGCTENPEYRMELQQGLEPWIDYKIDSHDDKLWASHLEAWHKGRLGFKLDEIYYKEKKSMLKVKQVGSYYQDKFVSAKDFLREVKNGVSFTNEDGDLFVFAPEDVDKLKPVVQPSRYGGYYIVPQAIKNLHRNLYDIDEAPNEEGIRGCDNNTGPCCHNNCIPEFQQIRDWATERGLYEKGDPKTQYLKLQEEAGEVARAILKNDEPEIIDGLGDTLVVLINLAHLAGYRLEDCLASAYDVISKRTGKMVNGTFVKSESL